MTSSCELISEDRVIFVEKGNLTIKEEIGFRAHASTGEGCQMCLNKRKTEFRENKG